MKVYLAADHRGFALKQELAEWLRGEGYDVTDVGAAELNEDDDYPDFGSTLAQAVAEDPANRLGIGLCGSGVGMAVVADKTPGIRASVIHDPEIARAARNDDNINVLALGADFVSTEQAQSIVKVFLETPFSGAERHQRRIDKIHALEKKP